MSVVVSTVDGDVAVIELNNQPVNALSFVLRKALKEAIDAANANDAVDAIVITGSDAAFIAGADVREFGTPNAVAEPRLVTLENAAEKSPKPVVAAITGVALGGGLEFALACHARIAHPNAKIGLPEVRLGLLPGAGGTVRLPRLTGPDAAADIITSGKHLTAEDALAHGIVDKVDGAVLDAAKALARKLAKNGAPKPVIERNDRLAEFSPEAFAQKRKAVMKKARGAAAQTKILNCIETTCTKPAAQALAFETAAFAELVSGDQHAAMKHAFFAEREARKIPGVPTDANPPLNNAGVIGSGLMGGGIAMVFANAGIRVHLIDVNAHALEKGVAMIARNYANSVARGSITQAAMDKALTLITPTQDYNELRTADVVVEAVYENMELKQEIFAALDKVMPQHAILASNTSSLDIDQIASATSRPESVIGAHFFSPANVMKLLEVVRGEKTSPEMIGAVFAMGRRLGKVPVLAGNCDGFIGNRMLQYYTTEAECMLEEGATPEQVDRVAESFGMAMGPLAMRDLAGMDTSIRIREIRRKTMPADEHMPEIVERLVEAGRIGQKNGKGYYRYEGRTRISDPETMAIIKAYSAEKGLARRELSDEEVRDRLFMPLVNEGAKELEDGTALRASDIDTVWLNGYGFPVHRGGPMFWGARVGLDRVVAMAEKLAQQNGKRWGPGDLLRKLAAEGKGWGDYA